ncbi:scarecrow-like protein 3 [Phtheirospermum japonicum]|uniref:Scarecrow-like protein 3 n=1 Tax=Phtheirospermum japonicum TaxID=374723 RepID=A0A830BB58_9LAMI|nr:scarecrow-like protein 3 [Phtheirospermum japonicum]
MRSEERGLCLIHLLAACANHVASGNIDNANIGLDYISHLASPNGDTMQRIAAYFAEALADRMLKTWAGLHKALNSTKIASPEEETLVRKLFFDFCPFLKLSYVITNQAILEAMEGEKVVHIIDLDSFEPAQWVSLIQALRARSEGPPHLRITCVHERKEVLDKMAHRLNEEAEKLDIPFQFNRIIVNAIENLDFDSLRVKTGEAVAVSSVLRLHSLLAVDDDKSNDGPTSLKKGIFVNTFSASPDSALSKCPRMTSFLSALRSLLPKIVVVTEQESNHNELNMMDRIMEALNYYAALFDCLESTVPIASVERQKIEKMLYGKEINSIIACEGMDRKKRHEKLEKWVRRLELAGFGKVALSYHVMLQARRLLQSYNYDGYKVREENGCFLICWQDQPLFSVSAWRIVDVY